MLRKPFRAAWVIGLDFKLILGGAIVAGALFLGTQGDKPLINLAGSGGGPSASEGTGTAVTQDAAPPNPQLEQLTKVITDFLGGDTSAGETIKDITGTTDGDNKPPDIMSKKEATVSQFSNTLPTYQQNLESNLAGINEQYGASLFVKLPLAGDATMYSVNPAISSDAHENVQEVERIVAGATKGCDDSAMYCAVNPNTGVGGYVYAPKGLDAAFGTETKKEVMITESVQRSTLAPENTSPLLNIPSASNPFNLPATAVTATSNKTAASNHYANIFKPATTSPAPVATTAPAPITVKKAATVNLWAAPKYPSIAQMMAMG